MLIRFPYKLGLYFIPFFSSFLFTSPYSYILTLQIPSNLKSSIGIRAYYKGHPLTLDHWALLPENNKQFAFSLIITEKISKKIDPETGVRYLQRKISKKTGSPAPFKWFDFTLVIDPLYERGYRWTVKELTDTQAPLRIPDHGIIILAPPRIIDDVDRKPALLREINDPEELEELSPPSTIQLPPIIINPHLTQKQLDDALLPAIIRSTDLNLDHRLPEKKTQVGHKNIISRTVTQ